MAVKEARVTELADVHDSKSCEVTPHVGSTPTPGTQRDQMGMREPRMAARQAHHAVDSGKTQSVYSAVRSSSRLFLR